MHLPGRGVVRHLRITPPAAAALVVAAALLLPGAAIAGSAVAASGAGAATPPRVGTETPVTAMDQTVAPGNTSPTLLADPGDPRFVVLANRLDGPDFGCALQLSGDGGRTWTPANPVPVLPAGAEKCYAPEVAFDRTGTLYYLFAGLAGRGNEPMGVFLTASRDRGRTFSPPRRVLGPLHFAVRMAIDPGVGRHGRLHLVWIKATSDPGLGAFGPPPNPILTAHSDDGGVTFSDPVQVNDPDRMRVVAPALALGRDGSVHVAYYDLQDDAVDYQGLSGPVWDGTWSLVLATSRDGGRRFGEGVVVDAGIVPFERVMLIFTMAPPALAAGADGRLCLGWADGRMGDGDVLVRCSKDGQRWSGVRRVNDDQRGNGVTQYMPRLGIAPSGRIDAVFYDRRHEPGNFVNDLAYASSADGGRTWSRNVRVSAHGSDSRVGARYANPSAAGLVEFGSRLGVLSRHGELVAAWTDTRNSRPGTTGQDIFSAVITAASGDEGQRPLPLGLALVGGGAAGLGAALWLRRRSIAQGAAA